MSARHKFFRKHCPLSLLLSLVMLLGVSFVANPAQARSAEHELGAVFLYNFLDFMHWPQATPEGTNTARFCIIGNSDIAENLLYIGSQPSASQKHSIEVINAKTLAEIPNVGGCHIVYLDDNRKTDADDLMKAIAGRPILTVSNKSKFASSGGAVEFTLKGSKLGLRINRRIIQTCGLSISPQLLSLAEVIDDNREFPSVQNPKKSVSIV